MCIDLHTNARVAHEHAQRARATAWRISCRRSFPPIVEVGDPFDPLVERRPGLDHAIEHGGARREPSPDPRSSTAARRPCDPGRTRMQWRCTPDHGAKAYSRSPRRPTPDPWQVLISRMMACADALSGTRDVEVSSRVKNR
jgi:hypothetical protein